MSNGKAAVAEKINTQKDNTKGAEIALIKKDTVDVVAAKIRQFQERGELQLPPNYSAENAMKAAWLALQEVVDKNGKPALEVCTRSSIANALLKMVIQGLNPAKNQCYFTVFGNKLVLMRSYFGSIHVAKSVNKNIEDIVGEVVYDGDEFEFEKFRGKTRITKHKQKLENIEKNKIKAAYATVIYKDKDGREDESIVMTIDEIKQAWKQSPMHPVDEKGNIKAGTTHEKFTAEMCKKTVINRICKPIINGSDDSNIVAWAAKRTQEDLIEAEVEEEIEENANSEMLDIDYEVAEEEEENSTEEDTAEDEPAEEEKPVEKASKPKAKQKEQQTIFEGPGF